MSVEREQKPYYIGTSDQEISEMLKTLGLNELKDLFLHIDQNVRSKELSLPTALSHTQIRTKLQAISEKNFSGTSFAGDALTVFKTSPVLSKICDIRGLTTAYTPYQPERSQGTLISLWLYQSLLSELTGFEAINASLYERSTALYEALKTATRIKRNETVILCESIFPQDREVVETLAIETELNIVWAPLDHKTGLTDLEKLKDILKNTSAAGFAFPQVNGMGLLEDVNQLTDLAHHYNTLAISIIDPLFISNNGLKRPSEFGQKGCDIFIAEGQSLALDANFGGPGLGVFGVRYNDENRLMIRSTPGRYVGNALDLDGKTAKAIILSTREQHIRREKATSNICSNQSFVATLASANLLTLGSEGIDHANQIAQNYKNSFLKEVSALEGAALYTTSPSYNSILLKLDQSVDGIIKKGLKNNIHIGVDLSNRYNIKENLLLITFSNIHSEYDFKNLVQFFKDEFKNTNQKTLIQESDLNLMNQYKISIPKFSEEKVLAYYQELGKMNLSPDDGLYPLGSCTMKYNPKINDEMASLKGFTQTHPELPIECVQGNLEILFEIQEWFKKITGLPYVTTQPVAGAQGELVGLKLFQAYHQDRGEKRDLILIPRSAHGTNPATAVVAGFETKNIINLNATPEGKIDMEQFVKIISEYGPRISGVMVTNPNTAGIFETDFHQMSELIHQAGGLVYMDGANMNAIAGQVDLGKLGVDAVHNNLHKTWTIPHGGGGPGDAIVAVSEKLKDYLPGLQIQKTGNQFTVKKMDKSIGSFHRHFGNFAHKVRCYSYLLALGEEGIKKMSAVSVLSARYLYHKLKDQFPTLPRAAGQTPRMHEFILTLSDELFEKAATVGIPKAQVIGRIGKLFLDFGFHAPTVAFPEPFGLMVEPTESFTKKELDEFADTVTSIFKLATNHPEVLLTTPHFTPIRRVDEATANKKPQFFEKITQLPELFTDLKAPKILKETPKEHLWQEILKAHQSAQIN